MASTTIARLSFEEFEEMPERAGKNELLSGELIELPPLKRKHGLVTHRLRDLLREILKDKPITGLGEALIEMGFRFGDSTWLVPDVSITHANQPGEDYFLNAPAVAIEVISESNTAEHVEAKVGIYLANGALEVWILYPKQQHLRIFRPNGTTEVFQERFESGLLGGAEINLTEILAG